MPAPTATSAAHRPATTWAHYAMWPAIAFVSAAISLPGQSADAQSPPRSASDLQALVNDTALQFHLAYRHNLPEYRGRHKRLVQVISAWRAARRNDANRRLLAEWLRGAIRSSMPGSHDPLPPMPKFQSAAAVVNSKAADSSPAAPLNPKRDKGSRPGRTSAPARDKSTGDPFGDDPI